MNNTQKYTSLVGYSIKLSRSMQKFDTVFLASRPPKQMGSFNVSMRTVNSIMDNIKNIKEMQDKMRKLATLDEVAKKDNKAARKASEQIDSIKAELNQSYSGLKDEFFKQIKIAFKQCKDVEKSIKDRDDKNRFHEASKDFQLMAYEAENEKYNIPLNEKDELTQFRQDQAKNEHQKQEKQIDSISESELKDADKLEEALGTLTAILAATPKNDLSNEVRKEVVQIKKVLTPNTIAIAKESLEQLRHSSQLLLDLGQINEIMQTTYKFTGKDGKLQKINKQLDALRPLLAQAIKEEKERNMDIKQEHDAIQGKVDYATEAVKTYGSILDNNARLEHEQMQIRDNTHAVYGENERLEEDAKKASAAAHEINMKPADKQEWNDGLILDQLYERARNDRQAVRDNEIYMADKMAEKTISTLPLQYTDMKKRLQNISSLYQMQITQAQELSNGGMPR